MLKLTEVQVSSVIYTSSYIYRLCEKDDSYVTTEILILLSVIYRVSLEHLLSDKYSKEDLTNDKYLRYLKGHGQESIIETLRNNLCLYLSEKRNKANSTTIDNVLKKAKNSFGEKISNYRRTNNLSLDEASEIFGVQKMIYQAFESGNLLPSVSQLRTIENKFNISISDLIGIRQK